MWAAGEVIDQSGIGMLANPPQKDQIKIVVIDNDLEIITRFYLTASPDGFGNNELPALADVRGHEV